MIIKYKNMYYKCNPTKIDNVNDIETDFDKIVDDAISNGAWNFLLLVMFIPSICLNLVLGFR